MNWYLEVLKKYAVFEGRARRKEYWCFVVINAIIVAVLERAFSADTASLYQLLVLLPALGVAVRRMHDVGKSWWYMLIPIYNIILMFTDSDYGPNRFGEDPKIAERYAQ